MSPQLHRLLSIQGELLDKFLEQNLGERYAYLIVVAPVHGPVHVGALSNLSDRGLVEPMLKQFAARLGAVSVNEVVEVTGAQALEDDGGGPCGSR